MTYIAGCDLETDILTDDKGEYGIIAQWAVMDNCGKTYTGTTADEFRALIVNACAVLPRNPTSHRSDTEAHFYFHNLNFDANFLLGILRSIPLMTCMKATLIAPRKHIINYTLTPTEASKELGYSNTVKILDSLKKCPSNLESIGRLIGKPKLDGVSEDFHPGWSLETDFDDPKNWEYVKRDAEICRDIMVSMEGKGLIKATAAGCAWADAKATCGTRGPQGKRYVHDFKWESHLPELSRSFDERLRQAYTGGINYSLPGTYYNCIHYDVTSMYPTCMMFDVMPMGKAVRVERSAILPGQLTIGHYRIKMHLKPEGIPWFKFKLVLDRLLEDIADPSEPVRDCRCYHDLWLSSVDYQNLTEHYDIEEDEKFEGEFYAFRPDEGFFGPYVEKWIAAKNHAGAIGDKVSRQTAKIMLNSLYGRTGLRPTDETFNIERSEDLDGWFEITVGQAEELGRHDAYIPYAIFVTSYARRRLLRFGSLIRKLGGTLIHADTDSWIVADVDPAIVEKEAAAHGMRIGEELGEWKVESRPYKVIEGGVKRYVEFMKETIEDLGDINVCCAGVPQTMKQGCPRGMWLEILDRPEIIDGSEVLGHRDYKVRSLWLRETLARFGLDADRQNTMKLMPKKIRGGVKLEATTFDPTKASYVLKFNGRKWND